MSESTILETLRGVEFFHGIAEEHLKRLADISRLVDFPANTNIFRENDTAKDVYLIISGEVSLVICQAKVGCRELVKVGDGDLIGWSPLVARPRLSDTARTLTATKAIAFNGEQALALCSDDTELGFEFMHRVAQVLAQRLSATRMQLMEMSGVQLPDVQLESD